MKLIGYTVRRASAGVFGVHVPLDDLTVLLGANDAGKSTILRALHEDLSGGPERREWGDRDGGAIFVELTDNELGLLLPQRSGSGMSPDVPKWDFGDYGYHLGDATTDATPEAYAAALAAAAVDAPASFAIVLEALQTSRTVCLESTGRRRDGSPDFVAHWCLPPLATLDAKVADALHESHLLRFRRERSQAAAETAVRLPFRMRGAAVAHLLLDAAPVLVAPLRWSTVVQPPRPLMGPAPFPDLVNAIGDGVSSIVKTGRFQPRDVVHATPLDAEEKSERVAPRLWLMRTEADDGWQIDPLASAALRIVEAEARRLLPVFVTERYQLGVSFREVDRWFVEHPIRVDLTPTGAGGLSYRSFDMPASPMDSASGCSWRSSAAWTSSRV